MAAHGINRDVSDRSCDGRPACAAEVRERQIEELAVDIAPAARGRGHGAADEPRRPGHQHGRRGLERAHSGFRARLRGRGGEDSGPRSRPGGRRRHPWGDGRRNTDRVDGISNTVHPLGHWWPFDRGCTASDCHSILQDRWAHRLLPRSAAVLLGNARSSEPPMSRASRDEL